jgi:hypothetical protein
MHLRSSVAVPLDQGLGRSHPLTDRLQLLAKMRLVHLEKSTRWPRGSWQETARLTSTSRRASR